MTGSVGSQAYKSLRTYGDGVIKLEGTIGPNGSGTPTAPHGKGFTVTRTGTGEFTVAWNNTSYATLAVVCTLQLASLTARFVQLKTVSTAGFVVTVIDATATAQDVTANAANIIHFSATISVSSLNA